MTPHRTTTHLDHPDRRLAWLRFGVVLFTVAVIGKLFYMQVVQHGDFVALAQGQHETTKKISAHRGKIFLTDSQTGEKIPVAHNTESYLVYAVPKQVEDAQKSADAVTNILMLPETSDTDMSKEKLLDFYQKKEKWYVPVKHFVSREIADRIIALEDSAIRILPEDQRVYPEKSLAAPVIGYVQRNDDGSEVGHYGIEGAYNDVLSGVSGEETLQQDGAGRWFEVDQSSKEVAHDGSDVVLTIDPTIQSFAESEISAAVDRYGAERGSIIVADPNSGDILAMAAAPSFDPNDIGSVSNLAYFNNPATFDLYEPGSIFKPFVIAAAMDLGLVSPDSTHYDSGVEKIDGYTIKNSSNTGYGIETTTQILLHSSNIGMIFVARQLGLDRFVDFLKTFGFADPTGIAIDTETAPQIQPKKSWAEVDLATASFGQGIGITPIQVAMAQAALANGGKLYAPRIVKSIVHPDGSVEETAPKVVREIIKPSTSAQISAMMVESIEKGLAYRAKVDGYYLGGKTGTAQEAGDHGYAGGRRNISFTGFGPARDPKFVIMIKLANPKRGAWGEDTTAPMFSSLAKKILDYYHIPRDY